MARELFGPVGEWVNVEVFAQSQLSFSVELVKTLFGTPIHRQPVGATVGVADFGL